LAVFTRRDNRGLYFLRSQLPDESHRCRKDFDEVLVDKFLVDLVFAVAESANRFTPGRIVRRSGVDFDAA